ncbi:MAG TPA: DMT family transporter [Silvibacterium sp.]|nr:DMT family transporter [Silvibacterium sp.]
MNWRTASAFGVVGLLWGSAWIPSSIVLPRVPGFRAGALRFAIAAAFVTLLALAKSLRADKQSRGRLASTLGPSFVLGVTAVAGPYTLMMFAAGEVSSGVVATLLAVMPLATLFTGGEGSSRAIPALVIGIGGVAMLVAQGLSTSTAQIEGAVLIAIAVALSAFSLNYAQRRMRQLDLLTSVAIQFAVAAILLGGLSAMIEHRESIAWSGQVVLAVLVLGIAVSGVTLPLMYWLLTKLEAWQVAALQWTATLTAVAQAAWFLRAKPSAEMWVGVCMIVGATFWLLRAGGDSPQEAVTLQITNRSVERSTTSESEVGSKIDLKQVSQSRRMADRQ